MAKCSNHKNPLPRGGTSQSQRLPPGLRSDYVQVDEKDFAGWIVFAQKFGAYLHYYNLANEVSGNWQSFFSQDISAVLGTIAIQDVENYRTAISDRLHLLQAADDEADVAELKTALGDLFSALFSFAKAVDAMLQKLPADLNRPAEKEVPLSEVVENTVKLRLQPALKQAIHYYKGGKELSLITENVTGGWQILNREVENAHVLVILGLEERWWKEAGSSFTTWEDYYNSINNTSPPDTAIYGTVAEDYKKLTHLANHNLFKSILDEFLSAFSKFVSEAEKKLLQTLENWDTHPAHYTLFLSFLKLFKQSQQHLNTITQRHLDFYYKDVLRLLPKPAAPDSAHVIIALSKQADSQLLPAGTLFRGGKDSAGNEVYYTLDKEVVFNKASVAQLMAWYKGTDADSTGTVNNAERFFAAPVIHSADGLGKEIETEFKEWHPYMVKDKATGLIAMPKAQVGFALASHYLFLAEGERRVLLKLASSNNSLLQTLSVDCYLTTEEGWLKITPAEWDTETIDLIEYAVLPFTLEGDAPAITAWNGEVHGGSFDVQTPVVKVILRNEDTAAFTFSEDIAKLTITRAAVEVQVGLNSDGSANDKGLKQLLVSSDTGIIDISKTFKPFGTQPKQGNYFIIGNKELFSKEGGSFKVNVEWTNLPGSADDIAYDNPKTASYPKVDIQFLEKGLWTTGATAIEIFNGTDAKAGFPSALKAVPENGDSDFTEVYNAYDQASRNGFVRFTLNSGFGHAAYQTALTQYLVKYAINPNDTSNTKPTEPYTPEALSMTVSYNASALSDLTSITSFSERKLQFFHLYPFGEAEQHAAINGAGALFLLPQFTHVDEKTAVTVQHRGEFYIGLKDLLPNQSLHLLIQVLEGTTDPRISKPENHVHWSYLSQNQWLPFDERAYDDATLQLIQSGIISFVLPANATTDNTILPDGYIWLRAAIREKPAAVCEVLSVSAQAAKVTLQLTGVAPDFLQTPLPAGTIAKLKNPLTAIKKIEQPFPSFGGRMEEASGQFYIRVSERLRHKARAITIWDYERLVLEAFPQIHKVKCLNHTRIEDDLYNEVAPGYVSIITIPKTAQRNDVNPLQPYTNQDLLTEIETYLRKKTSCHVKVFARQPQFEEVRLTFALKLQEGYEFTYYSGQLKEEITQFLSPWAFTGAAEPDFGGKVHKSVLINFIEERPYVDYITNVQMEHLFNGDVKGSNDVVTASTARSILVSVPAVQHVITQIEDSATTSINEICNECGKV